MLWVQQVDVLYTKTSRGAPQATVRNQLPRAFAMMVGTDTAFAFERYTLSEWRDFFPVLIDSGTAISLPHHQNNLVIAESRDAVTLGLVWNNAIGQPPRRDQPAAITLKSGQTARLIINGRHASYSGQVYTETTYNVALGKHLEANVFTAAEPITALDMKANLF
jgi:hypothetical protein